VGTEGELKEYTYVMENRDMPKTVLEDVSETPGDLVGGQCGGFFIWDVDVPSKKPWITRT